MDIHFTKLIIQFKLPVKTWSVCKVLEELLVKSKTSIWTCIPQDEHVIMYSKRSVQAKCACRNSEDYKLKVKALDQDKEKIINRDVLKSGSMEKV